MKLDRIHIKNFRSIKDCTIKFDHNCIILLGKNEAGKSNILKAIASVFNEYSVSNKDRRKRIDNEKIDEYFVRAVFTLEQKDTEKIIEGIRSNFSNIELVEFKNNKSVEEYINICFKEFLVQIDIETESSPHYSYWRINENIWGLKKPLFKNANELLVEGKEKFNLNSEVFKLVQELYKKNSIDCNYWQYKEDYLLPNTVSIEDFINDSASHKALGNIFVLCNRGNIAKEFKEAFEEDGDYSNLLEQVSRATTKVFHSIWKDFKNTSIALIPNGNEEILIKVVNKTKYSFEDRSDGFKKFISILLMLSTEARSNRLDKKNVILIDEPDQSLYPTSARYLRDELLRISEFSQVIYSTHSHYMIDSLCIDRHLIIDKTDDITTINKQDDNSPFSDDELLMNAIGASIFECLKPINIIFEGWLDNQIFNKYCDFNRDKRFDNYGKVYLRGISGHEALIQLLILADKKFLIVADSDKTSNDKRKDFEVNYPQYKDRWLAYGDVVTSVSTMEDFLDIKYISKTISDFIKSDYNYDLSKSAIENIQNSISNDKVIKQDIKNNLIKNLTKNKIIADYKNFIDELYLKLGKL